MSVSESRLWSAMDERQAFAPGAVGGKAGICPRQAVGGKARRGFKRADMKSGSSGAAETRERKKAALRKEKTDE